MNIDITKVLRAENTVFTIKDLAILWQETNSNLLKSKANYYVKTGQLKQIRRGIYAKNSDYEQFELACKIYKPSYISLNTVNAMNGLNFQYYSSIFVISYLSREIKVDGCGYNFHKIKDSILTNMQGIKNENGYSIATLERGFLDTVYMYGDKHFDNLNPINWDKAYELVTIYDNKRMIRSLDSYYKIYKEEYLA
jgi:hypothetical protein